MKIAIFIRGYVTHGIFGGMPNACKTLAEGLVERDCEVHVITTGHQQIINGYMNSVHVHHVACEPLKYTPQWYENAHKKYIELGNDFDVAYSESGANSQFVEQLDTVKIARLHGVSYEEVINHLNLIYVKKRMPNEKDFEYINKTYIQYFKDIEILQRYDALVAISHLSEKILRNRFFHRNIHVIYNAYDDKIFYPKNIEYNPLLFVSAGHNADRKGFGTAKQAITIAKKTLPNLEFIIAHNLSQEKLAELYQSACAFIDASNHYTGMNMTCIEAIACGIPVICSDMENFREITDEGQLYFPLGNAEELARKIICIHNDEGWRYVCKENALESSRKFHKDKHITEHLALFKNEIERRNRD